MPIVVWAVGTYLLLAVQTAFGPSCAIGPFQPNLLIALCVPCLCRSHSPGALCGAAVWGLAVDLLGSGPLGINLIGFTLIAALSIQRNERHADSLTRVLLLTAFAVCTLTAVELAAQWPLADMTGRWRDFTIFIAGNSLYSFAVAVTWIVSCESLRRTAGRMTGRVDAWG